MTEESELYRHETKTSVYVWLVALMFAGISLSWFGTSIIRIQSNSLINLVLSDSMSGTRAEAQLARGAQLQEQQCSGCHSLNKRLVGPSYAEIVDYYNAGDGILVSDGSSMISGAISHVSDNWSNYPKGPSLRIGPEDRSALTCWIMKNVVEEHHERR